MNKAPVKDTVKVKEETNATGEQESSNTGTVTTIVTVQQGSSETQQTELSASTQFNIISTGLVLRENQTKKVMLLMLLLMIISSSARLIDDSLGSLKKQYDKWREKIS